ncbi:MAG: hemerythrin domain-containing protein [Gammaproteobacteria bacterium]
MTTTTKTKPRSGKAQADHGTDAIALLKADHRAVRKLFEDYEALAKSDGDATERQALAARICTEISIHAQIEEELFYPALREAVEEQDLLDEAEVEHSTARELIGQIESMEPGEELYDAKVTVLGEYVNHHVEEEEKEIFKLAKKSDLDLDAIGEELAARRDELAAQLGTDADEEDDDAER